MGKGFAFKQFGTKYRSPTPDYREAPAPESAPPAPPPHPHLAPIIPFCKAKQVNHLVGLCEKTSSKVNRVLDDVAGMRREMESLHDTISDLRCMLQPASVHLTPNITSLRQLESAELLSGMYGDDGEWDRRTRREEQTIAAHAAPHTPGPRSRSRSRRKSDKKDKREKKRSRSRSAKKDKREKKKSRSRSAKKSKGSKSKRESASTEHKPKRAK